MAAAAKHLTTVTLESLVFENGGRAGDPPNMQWGFLWANFGV